MKTKLLLITVLFISTFGFSQTILIPNGGFNIDTSGWAITGTDTSINASGGEMYLNVSGIYTRDFILTSPQFYLDASKAYKLFTEYKNTQYDPMMGEIGLGGFWGVNLKDINGTTVTNVGLVNGNSSGYLEEWSSGSFNIVTSGVYYLEYTGQHSQDAQFIVDNVGFREVIENTFSGKVTLDVNNDGCSTSSTIIENFSIQLNETNSNTSYNVLTDANGDFSIETSASGNFVTQTNQTLYNATPANYTNTINSGINNITNQDFCVTPNSVVNDVIVSIIPTTQARPGFNTAYQLRYTNIGTTTLSGVVDLTYDNTKVTFLGASIPPTATTSPLIWSYNNLMPLETRYIDINFNIFTPPTVNNGDILSYTASVTPITGDYTPTNNTFTFDQITIGSYDPNDITFLEGPLITETQADDFLSVIIRFQNTGTASAINITVENTLDAFLDWSTFQPIAASHNYNTVINNVNEIDFVFNGINLADSTTDEPGSHGWIYYRVKPKSTFVAGDIISNIAHIYFDYNLPIITNTATTQINTTLSSNEFSKNNLKYHIFPNPVKEKLTVKINNEGSFILSNLQGQTVKTGELQNGNNVLNISYLNSGIYFIAIKTSEGILTKKIVKK
ncbi:T9SS type A sorting domain-containing protein [Lutibacter sp. TH_r2]|uniref:T9SS type A sorting domain-containing protein n=1 Tax=Lutibacter sp. TH_r2 TaxID=3082083 RepID=UPI002952BCC2|nr:T9SS type A sorting domain-containing protein [Lutibacter sp. TH_r2]MDV7187670.1 T9SS type A sorting domain-containing protein [Lutibacter sp. TH_r2]